MRKELDVTTDSVVKIFFSYSIPTILGMVAISSASIVDGMFVGRYIGPNALAVVNMTIPYVSLLLGIITMLAAGGCVLCGKLMGEKRIDLASGVFSKIFLIMVLLVFSVWTLVLAFPNHLAYILGADNNIVDDLTIYLKNYTYFLPFQLLGIGVSYFARVNGTPGLTSFALFLSAIMNVFLDYLFVVLLRWGIGGAAFATGISQSMTFFMRV